jgi:hypothetical protein
MGSILDETDGFFSKIILVDFVRRPRQRERKRNGQGRRSQASQRATAHVCLYDSLVRVLRLWFRFASLKLNLLVLILEGCQLPSLLAPIPYGINVHPLHFKDMFKITFLSHNYRVKNYIFIS